jgi:hypothetical protein
MAVAAQLLDETTKPPSGAVRGASRDYAGRVLSGWMSESLSFRVYPRSFMQSKLFGSKDRTFDARPLVVPRPVGFDDLRHTTETRTEAAGHGRFERQPARRVHLATNVRNGFHHRLRAATVDMNTAGVFL